MGNSRHSLSISDHMVHLPFPEQKDCEGVELNVQIDHIHLLVMVVSKISISDFVGMNKDRTAIHIFNKFRHVKQKPYWVNQVWSRGCCIYTVGYDTEKIHKYVKHHE